MSKKKKTKQTNLATHRWNDECNSEQTLLSIGIFVSKSMQHVCTCAYGRKITTDS